MVKRSMEVVNEIQQWKKPVPAFLQWGLAEKQHIQIYAIVFLVSKFIFALFVAFMSFFCSDVEIS